MLALIFAGGEGSRLNLGEKALVPVGGRAMLSWVVDAFYEAGLDPVAVTSYKTPFTRNYCRAQGIDFIDTSGNGYLEDLQEAVEMTGDSGALFTAACDIPFLTPSIIAAVEEAYVASGKEACSTWVSLESCREYPIVSQYHAMIDGVEAIPCALNIFFGQKLTEEQSELALLLHDPNLAFNINTREELAAAERMFAERF